MRDVLLKRVYKHFKGDYYIVEDVALSSDDGKTVYVIYRKLYGDGGLYIREKSDFLGKVDKVKYPNVEQEYRFELQEIESKRK